VKTSEKTAEYFGALYTIEPSVLDRLGQVGDGNSIDLRKICNRARNLENAMISPR
jgi:hypothetical protein